MNTSIPGLVIDKVSKRFGSHVVLDQATAVVPANSVTVLVGANGSGKTTLLRCILSLCRFDGDVRWNGESLRPESRHVCPVFDGSGWFEHLSGLQNIRLLVPEAAQENSRYLSTEQLERRVRTYSQGQRMRLGLTMAFNSRAPLVVMDEPTNGLDEQVSGLLRSAIRERSSSTTFLVASHDIDFFEEIVDQLLLVEDAQISRVWSRSEDPQRRVDLGQFLEQ